MTIWEDLLRKADQVLGETPPEEAEEDAPPAPWEDLRFYANYSNHYGQDVRNYQNNYGRPNEPRPEAQEEAPGPAIPAYNVDFQNEDRRQPRRQSPRKNHRETYEEGEDLPLRPAPSRQPKPSKRRKKRRGVKLLAGVLLVVLLLIGGAYLWIRSTMKMPETDQPIGARKEGAATVLLCGTDQEGTRTDTMMLLYLNAREQAITLVSLPRDTLTHTSSGSDAKLNSAYGRNDGGQEGMEALLDYVSDIIGYRPDGYMLITLDAFVDVVNLMGGVEFDVPMDMFYEDPSQDLYIDLKEGKQKLDGYEAMGLVRFPEGLRRPGPGPGGRAAPVSLRLHGPMVDSPQSGEASPNSLHCAGLLRIGPHHGQSSVDRLYRLAFRPGQPADGNPARLCRYD